MFGKLPPHSRRWHRLPLQVLCALRTLERKGEEVTRLGKTLNVSQEGALVISSSVFPQGSTVTLEIPAPLEPKAYGYPARNPVFQAKVVWTRRVEQNYLVGLKFDAKLDSEP